MTTDPTVAPPGTPARLCRQLEFLREADQLKTILRRNRVVADPARRENDAEHTFHFALLAIVLAEYADARIDLLRVLKMVLIHDLVEIDAGDAFIYDAVAQAGKRAREVIAADRIFGLLPDDQRDEMRALWDEFEAETTPEACFAAAVDRLQPLLGNFWTQGGAWQEHGVGATDIRARNEKIGRGSPALWAHALRVIDESRARGYIPRP